MLVISSSLKPPSTPPNPSPPPLTTFPELHTSILPIYRRHLLAVSTTLFVVFAVDSTFRPVAAAGGLFSITQVQLCDSAEEDSKMRPKKEPKRRSRPSSPLKDRTAVSSGYEPRSPGPQSSRLSLPVSLLDRDLVTDDSTLLEELSVSQDLRSSSSNPNPRSFPYTVKQQCWDKAEKIKGRDPDRWRRDALGNNVFRKLVGCPGCLCHDYDHIVPYSKGGQSTLENCQVLQVFQNSLEVVEEINSAVLATGDSLIGLNKSQVATWISLSFQPMATSVVRRILGDVESNNQFQAVLFFRESAFRFLEASSS